MLNVRQRLNFDYLKVENNANESEEHNEKMK